MFIIGFSIVVLTSSLVWIGIAFLGLKTKLLGNFFTIVTELKALASKYSTDFAGQVAIYLNDRLALLREATPSILRFPVIILQRSVNLVCWLIQQRLFERFMTGVRELIIRGYLFPIVLPMIVLLTLVVVAELIAVVGAVILNSTLLNIPWWLSFALFSAAIPFGRSIGANVITKMKTPKNI